MKEIGKQEIRVISHIILVTAVAFFSLVLIVLNLYKEWDNWTIPLLVAAPLVCLGMHVLRKPDEILRVYFYSTILFLEIFYYMVHADYLYDGIPLIMLTLAFLAMTREVPLLWVCISVGILGFFVRIAEFISETDSLLSVSDLIKCAWNIFLVIATGMAITKMLRTSDETQLSLKEKFQAMEQDTKRADIFLANVSNEIRMPVDEVIGLSDSAYGLETDERVKEKLGRISYIGHKVAEQIGDILDYSELEMNRVSVSFEEYRLSDILDDLVKELKLFKRDDIELVIDVDPRLPAVLKTDIVKLKRVLWHVILNAIKYTEEGGVYVRISFTKQEYGLNLIIDVEDTGIGMDETELERIYERFYRSEGGKAAIVTGLGLGMSIVLGFVIAMEGFINIKSAPGKGTHVHITLPQEIVDPSHCMIVPKAPELEIGGYLQFEKFRSPYVREYYNSMMRNLREGLGVSFYRVDKPEDLYRLWERHSLTHLIVGEVQYEADTEYMDELSHELTLIILCNDDFKVSEGSEAVLLRKPFYCFPVTKILNGYTGDKKDTAALSAAPLQREEKETGGEASDETFEALRKAGIDPEKGLEWCMDDREVYTAVLQECALDAKNKKAELEKFYAAGDWENFMIRIHGIKSSAKTIGASEISERAKRLEKAAEEKDEAFLKEHYPKFLPDYIRLTDMIREVCGEAEEEGEDF